MDTVKSFTKNSLIAEIAGATKLSKAAVGRVFDQLTQIAYREASTGFVIPGICKLKVVKRKASRHRNPFTGKLLLIGERSALKIVPLKKAKTAVTPNIGVSVQVVDDLQVLPLPATPPALAPAAAPTTPSAPSSQPPPNPAEEEGQIVFPCPECGSMIAAPFKTAGKKGDCPFCKAALIVPQQQLQAKPDKQVLSDSTTPEGPASDFVAFVCRACGQEIEAPVDMIGMAVECPTCGTGLRVPVAGAPKPPPPPKSVSSDTKKYDASSMTIRIDLSDLG